jgi:lysophospholipase L1-like esterase
MGSSYAAGPGLGEMKPGTPARCARSTVNYATLLAARLDLMLDDQSCSGATIAHILGPWGELPAQIDAVTPETRLVTVTIGGNDLNFVGALFAASCRSAGDPRSCPEPGFPDEADYSAVERELTTLAQEVRRRAPEARLVFVQYVRVVPGQVCAATPIDPTLAARSLAVEERLFAITAKVATDNGASVLPADELSRTHTPCDATPWSNGNPLGYDGATGAPWHPNAAGMAGIAAALEQLVSRP